MRKVLAFADMGDSEEDSDSDQENDAARGYADLRGSAAPKASAQQPATTFAPVPAALRPIRVALPPETGAKPTSGFTSAVHMDGDCTPDRVSPTSVLPPLRAVGLGVQAPAAAMYTYFDKDAGTLVTACIPQPTPAPLLVPPPGAGSDEEEDWDAPDRSFVAKPPAPVPAAVAAAALVPPPMPIPISVVECPAPARRPSKPVRRKRAGGGAAVVKLLLTSAVGVGLALLGKDRLVAGVKAAERMMRARLAEVQRERHTAEAAAAAPAAAHRRARPRSSSSAPIGTAAAQPNAMAAVSAPVRAEQNCSSASCGASADAATPPGPVVTEWQPRTATRLPGAPPPSEAPDAWHPAAMRTREVRWQPHVSLGRG